MSVIVFNLFTITIISLPEFFMKRGGYDRHLHNKTRQDLMRLVVEGTSCNGEVIRRNNLQLEGETTFSLKAKRFSGEEDRREFKM